MAESDAHTSGLPIEVSISTDLESRIAEAFEVFDHGGSKTIDVREVGTVLRSLGCCPTEAEIQEILVQVEDIETSSVHLSRFLPIINQIMIERNFLNLLTYCDWCAFRLLPSPAEDILKAFKTLDKENNGFIDKDYMARLLLEEGEPFTQEELNEMMSLAADSDTGQIAYEYYINQLLVSYLSS